MILNSRLSCFRRSSVHAEKNRVQNRNYKSRPRRAVSTKQLILRMVKIIRRIIYVYDSNLLAANSFSCCLRTASPQGIAALAVQRGVATLTERSDELFSVMQPSSDDRE